MNFQSKGDISTLDRLCHLNGINGKSNRVTEQRINGEPDQRRNGVHSEGMVHSLLDDEHAENWKPEIPFENVRRYFFKYSGIRLMGSQLMGSYGKWDQFL